MDSISNNNTTCLSCCGQDKIFSSEDESYETICIRKPLLKKQGTVNFKFVEHPRIVIYVKPDDDEVFEQFLRFYQYIEQNKSKNEVICIIEENLFNQVKANEDCLTELEVENNFEIFDPSDEEIKSSIKFLCTLGGDGTILYAAKQFNGHYIPPIITFSMGSLGYLCYFEFEEYKQVLDRVLFQNYLGDVKIDPSLDIRMRLCITVNNKPIRKVFKGGQFQNFDEMHIKDYHLVNEVVIDRGPSPYAIQIQVYIDNNFFTTCVGDGLIVCTPTGSTAYNLSAGGPILQANVPAITMTPLAPHSLSFRPLIIPENAKICLKNPDTARSSVWVGLDGATRFELDIGESISVKASSHGIAFVTDPTENLTDLWAQRLVKLLHWNVRPKMKPIKKNYNVSQDSKEKD